MCRIFHIYHQKKKNSCWQRQLNVVYVVCTVYGDVSFSRGSPTPRSKANMSFT